mmetsp:Transcript_14985/g.60160  ORF Transcript_14985/g.60160 Transcript_14985/m.60160 type:complete len:267 (-) Transcript_14985:1636-2436(-)
MRARGREVELAQRGEQDLGVGDGGPDAVDARSEDGVEVVVDERRLEVARGGGPLLCGLQREVLGVCGVCVGRRAVRAEVARRHDEPAAVAVHQQHELGVVDAERLLPARGVGARVARRPRPRALLRAAVDHDDALLVVVSAPDDALEVLFAPLPLEHVVRDDRPLGRLVADERGDGLGVPVAGGRELPQREVVIHETRVRRRIRSWSRRRVVRRPSCRRRRRRGPRLLLIGAGLRRLLDDDDRGVVVIDVRLVVRRGRHQIDALRL